MTNEEALKHIQAMKLMLVASNNQPISDSFYALEMAEEALERSRWIPVSEKLPSDCNCDWVLAQIQEDNGYLWIPKVMEYRKNIDDWYSGDEELGWLKDHNGAFKVVAWQPLPEPYKAESEETETWNGIHAQITAPKGTFERIFNNADDDNDI